MSSAHPGWATRHRTTRPWATGHRAGAAVCAALAATVLTGCGGGAPPAAPSSDPAAPDGSGLPPMPPRPVELPLAGVEPCDLLTPEQQDDLGIPGNGHREANSDLLGSTSCLWYNSAEPPHGAAMAAAVTKGGVDYFRSPPDQVIDINGIPALEAASPDIDPALHCLVLVDVAAGQTLWVQYDRNGLAPDGITHEIACERARETARAMVDSLRARLRR